jgi:hypothetical protein
MMLLGAHATHSSGRCGPQFPGALSNTHRTVLDYDGELPFMASSLIQTCYCVSIPATVKSGAVAAGLPTRLTI